jgi:hypothetical protein
MILTTALLSAFCRPLLSQESHHGSGEGNRGSLPNHESLSWDDKNFLVWATIVLPCTYYTAGDCHVRCSHEASGVREEHTKD